MKPHEMISKNLMIDETAEISSDARIIPSIRESKIIIGAHTHIYEFVIIKAVGGDGDIIIGENCYINPSSTLYSGNGITMGNYVLIGPGTVITPTNHAFHRRDMYIRHQGFVPSRGGVLIEEDVWIGANSVVLDGTHIERGALIAAGSVVRGTIPKYTIWAGVPAKYIKDRP
jgi:virginiamycin A acetyltransferase